MTEPISSNKSPGDRSISTEVRAVRLPFSGVLRDDWQSLAWANSICALFLMMGLLGFRPPTAQESSTSRHTNVVPVVFVPENKSEKLKPVFTKFSAAPTTANVETVAESAPPVAVAAEPAQVALSVPVQGPVTLVAPRYTAPASASPPSRPAGRGILLTFNTENNPHGYFPKPKYPPSELSAHHEGQVMLHVIVAPSGKPQTVTIRESSGWEKLDEAAEQKVLADWDFGAGNTRYYNIPVVFHIQ